MSDAGRVEVAQDALKATRADSLRNQGLCGFLAANGVVPKDEAALHLASDLYCVMDCIQTSVQQQARVAAVFAGDGIWCGKRIMETSSVRATLAMMMTAGMYEGSGDWALRVGLPAKSGVSGCVMVVVPGLCGISIHSPRLDPHGNSVRASAFLQSLVSLLPGLSIFSPSRLASPLSDAAPISKVKASSLPPSASHSPDKPLPRRRVKPRLSLAVPHSDQIAQSSPMHMPPRPYSVWNKENLVTPGQARPLANPLQAPPNSVWSKL